MSVIGDGDERPRGVQWFIDSGASAHMSASKEAMGDYTTVMPFEILIGDKRKLRVVGSGHVRLQVDVDGEVKMVTLKNVLHVPKLAYHLVSVSAMESNGMSTNFANGKCNIKDGKGLICAQPTKKGGMYVLDTVSGGVQGGTACRADVSISLWHARLGHANMRGIANMVKAKAVDGLACTGFGTDRVCESFV
jgi:GAG-pre-integrase domain